MFLKRCLRSRKGLSHVDWAMSLAIFLLYLAWYFIFVKPVIMPAESIGSLLDVLQDGVEENIFDDVQRLYFFVPGAPSSSTDLEPVIVDFSQSWDSHDIAHSADYFEIDDGRMFFLANLSGSDKYAVYYPADKVRTTARRDIIASETEASWSSFRAVFDEMLLSEAYFAGAKRILSFGIEVDDTAFQGDGEFSNLSLIAKYRSSDDAINNTAYVFAENPRIYSFIKPVDGMNHSVKLSFAFYNYSYFYISRLTSGSLTYGIGPQCRYYKTDFLDLYDADYGVLITFGRNISFGLCTNETNALLDLEFMLTGEDSYNIYFHEGNYHDMLSYPLAPVEGMPESLTVVSKDKAGALKNKDYDYLKQIFGYPDQKDFNIAISGAVSGSYGAQQPVASDIYARKIESFALNQDIEQESVSIALTVW